MAIRLLLDDHIPLRVARVLRERGIDVLALAEWHGGRYLSGSDEEILRAAYPEQRTLVTYDVQSIPGLIRDWAESGIEHFGVIYISSKSIRSEDVGALSRALERLLSFRGERDLRNQTLFLSR